MFGILVMSVKRATFWFWWCVAFMVFDLGFAAYDIAQQKWGFAILNLILGGVMFFLANVYWDALKAAKARAAHPSARR